MTWKTKLNHILSQSSMFNIFMFPNVSDFCENNCFQTTIAGAFVHIRNFIFCARVPSSFMFSASSCSSHLILGPNKTLGHAQTILSLVIKIYIYAHWLLKTSMRTHLPEKVRGTNLRDIKSGRPLGRLGNMEVHVEMLKQISSFLWWFLFVNQNE